MHVLQHICSSRVTLKYETLTLTLTLMFEHISTLHPRIELHTCGCAHVPSMRSVNANHARAGSVCTPFAARLQLTRNPKIRNPNPNPNPNVRTSTATQNRPARMWLRACAEYVKCTCETRPSRTSMHAVCSAFAAHTRNPKITHDPPGEPRALRVNKVAEVLETASVFSAQCIGATLSTHADL